MSALPKVSRPAEKMTSAEFLPWAEAQAGRYELVDVVPVKMQSERLRHLIVKGNIYVEFRNAVMKAGLACHVLPDGATVVISDDVAYEPDVVVQCSPLGDLNGLCATAPSVVVEVLSPSSHESDVAVKLPDYMTVPSILHVLIVDPVRQRVLHYERQSNAPFLARPLRATDTVMFDNPGFRVAIAGFFSGLGPSSA
jgi:Uma2 family endonuclease